MKSNELDYKTRKTRKLQLQESLWQKDTGIMLEKRGYYVNKSAIMTPEEAARIRLERKIRHFAQLTI